MAGPWENVNLPGPPNGPAWAQAAAQLMGATQNSINSGANAFQNWQNFNYQQAQRDFFQNPQNAQLLQDLTQSKDPTVQANARTGLFQALMQQGGAQTVPQFLPLMQRQQLVDEDIRQSQQPTNPTAPAAGNPDQIYGTKPNAGTTSPRTGYGTGEAPNINTLAANYNIPEPAKQRMATRLGLSSPEDDIPADKQDYAKQLVRNYVSRTSGGVQGGRSPDRGGGNPVAQAGTGNQETPQGIGGSGAVSPRPTSGSGGFNPSSGAATPNVQYAPGSFNDRFAPTGVTRAGAADVAQPSGATAMVPQEWRGREEEYARRLKETADQIRKSSNVRETLGIPTKSREDRANALDKTADAILEQLGKSSAPTDKMKEAAASRMSPLEYESAQERNKLRQAEFVAKNKGIQAADRAAAESDDDMRAMRGILNDPKLFTMAGNELVSYLRGGLINAGLMDPNAKLPNEALKKVTSKALQAQMDQMKDEAAAIGGSAGRIMLAQVNIMKDAAQNIEMSPSGLRYLTELMERSNQRTHEIAQLARDYNRRNGGRGLDDGFDQQLADYSRTHPIMTGQEIENHHLLSSPHLPEELQGAGASKIAQWAHGHGLKKGDPIRVPSNEPPGYEYRFSP